jgi:3-oxoacyl-ACP reductase-like protein
MTQLPVIVSFGGISPAGRSAFHYGYQRLVYDALSRQNQLATLQNLAVLTSHINWDGHHWYDNNNEKVELEPFLTRLEPTLLQGTLIRKLENNLFDLDLHDGHTQTAGHLAWQLDRT